METICNQKNFWESWFYPKIRGLMVFDDYVAFKTENLYSILYNISFSVL